MGASSLRLVQFFSQQLPVHIYGTRWPSVPTDVCLRFYRCPSRAPEPRQSCVEALGQSTTILNNLANRLDKSISRMGRGSHRVGAFETFRHNDATLRPTTHLLIELRCSH